MFAFDRLHALAPQHPEWRTQQPFKAALEGDKAGIWEDVPVQRPDFREKFRKAAAAQAKKRKSEEMV